MPFLDKYMNILKEPKKPYIDKVIISKIEETKSWDEIFYFDSYIDVKTKEVNELNNKKQLIYYIGNVSLKDYDEDFNNENNIVLQRSAIFKNAYPYHYNVKIKEEKITISSKLIVFNYYKGKLITRIISTAIVINMKTGKAYLLGTKCNNKLIKVSERYKNILIRDISHVGNHMKEYLNMIIKIPKFELQNILIEINNYKIKARKIEFKKISYNCTDISNNIENVILYNKFWELLISERVSLKTIYELNIKISLKGMKKNVLSYINLYQNRNGVVKNADNNDNVVYPIIYNYIKKKMMLGSRNKEFYKELNPLVIETIKEIKEINRSKIKIWDENRLKKIYMPEYIENWIEIYRTNTNRKERIEELSKGRNIIDLLEKYKTIWSKDIRIDQFDSDLEKLSNIYEESIKLDKLISLM